MNFKKIIIAVILGFIVMYSTLYLITPDYKMEYQGVENVYRP